MKKARLTLTTHDLILLHWCLVCRIDSLMYDKDFSDEAGVIMGDIENLLNKIKKKMPDIKYIKQRF